MKTKFPGSAWRIILALIICLSAAGLSVQGAQAAGYPVSNLNDSGAGSLRQAILNANSHAGLDTITFSVNGTITLAAGLPAISDDLTIDGSGQVVTISGNHLYRVFYINSGKTVTLDTLSITNGNGGSEGGGAIYNGGGILTVTNTVFSGNTAIEYGGAIDNEAGSITVTGCTFSSNSAEYGGAIDNYEASLTVTNSTFSSNNATYGGGILNIATASVTGSTFSGNSAQFGGGIENYGGVLTVTNSTFSGNSADDYGGGIVNFNGGTSKVINSTFSANSADDGSGIYAWTGGSLYLKNTILANSKGGVDCFNNGTLSADIHNLIESHSGCGTPVSSADPKLGSLASNGGPTKTFGLLIGSPAIDAGDDAACAAAPVSNLDQRGRARPVGAHCDIGSVEVKNESKKLTFRSAGSTDGWILESAENSTAGGSMNVNAATLRLGDDTARKQYRSILSFSTKSLPDNAVITKVTLKVKKQGITGGGNPVTAFQGFKVDIKKGFFGPAAALAVGDFQAQASKMYGPFMPALVSGWYSLNLTSGKTCINKLATNGGLTQVRLYFNLDDNNNAIGNYLSLYSGNVSTASNCPQLIIEYYTP